MSVKNTLEHKKIRRLERNLRKGRLPRYIDLVQWLVDHGHATTKKQARELIWADHVLSESHPLGKAVITETDDNGKEHKYQVFQPFVPADLVKSITLKTNNQGG
jgi:hypothetical protein